MRAALQWHQQQQHHQQMGVASTDQWQQQKGGVASTDQSAGEGLVVGAGRLLAHVLSTPHDGGCLYGQHGYEQQRLSGLSGSPEPEVGCVYFRCDHLMMHRYLCPRGARFEPALGECLRGGLCQGENLVQNNNTILEKAESRKKKPSVGAGGSGNGVEKGQNKGQEGGGPRVVCYFTNWAWYRKGEGKFLPENIEPALCTHIIYSFASLDPNDLTLRPFDSWSDIDNNFFARVVARAADSGASVLLAMGGWTDSAGDKYSRLVSDRATRQRFVSDAIKTLRQHKFDGLQLDWNYPVCWQSNCKKGPASDKQNFAKLVQELREAFDKQRPGLLLSVAISGYREIIDRAYDLTVLSRYAHFVSVMSFDYHGAWEHETGHVAPLRPTNGELYPDYNVDSTVKHLVELGADRSKLVVGVPFYGQSFTLAAPDKAGLGEETVDPGEGGEFTKQPGMLAYYEICYRIKKQGWKSESSEVGPYAYSGDQWVSYDDPTSIKQKAKYILDEKLGGAMAWTLDLDDFHNRCCGGQAFPLLLALNRGLGRITSPPTTPSCNKPSTPPTPPTLVTTLTPDNGLVSPEATTELKPTSTTTESWWWTEKPSTTTTTTTTTTEEPLPPETTDEVVEEETTTTSTTTTTTTTKRPRPTKPKPSKPKPTKPGNKPPPTHGTKPTVAPTVVTKPTTTRRPTTKPTKPRPTSPTPPTSTEAVAGTELPTSCTSGEYRADPTDCNAYYRCILGEFRRQRCAGSLHWNSRVQVCDWPQQAKCHVKPGHIESSTTTTGRPDEWWTQSSSTWWSPEVTTPHQTTASPPWWTPPTTQTTPTTATRPWWTQSTTTTTTTTKKPHRPSHRPPPHRPRPTSKPPTTTTTTTVQPLPSPAESCLDGHFYPVGGACDQYEVCVNGDLLRMRCAPGLLFNHLIGACDWSHNVHCSAPSRIEQELSSRKTVVGAGGSGCSKGQFTAHPTNCHQYLQCQWGAYQIYSCPPGLNWNSKNNICDWPSRSTCRVTSPSNSGVASGGGSSKPVAMETTTTNHKPEWEWKPESTTEWSWTSPATTPKPIRNKPSKPVQASKHPLAGGGMKVVCYFTNWAWYRTGPAKYLPEDIDASLCTHVLYGFAVLDFENLIIKAHDSWADFDNKFYERVVAMKQKGVTVLLAIGGWNDSQGDKYSRLVNSPAARQRFIKHVIPFLLEYDFDGLDLDWEYPKCWQVNCDKGPASDKESFGLFVKELKTAFRKHDLLLSAAVSPSKAVIDEGYDVKMMAEYLDWISVMTYDYHGQWDKKTGHLAPMYHHPEDDFDYFNANYSINYWLEEGVPRSKLVMGMPLYGQSFTLAKREQHGLNAPAPGPGHAGENTRAAGFLAYYEICSRIKDGSWTVVQDEEKRMGPYAYKGDQWISFDDKDAIRRKSEWIREMGIGGGMVWALDLDDFRNTCGGGKHPLLTIIAKTLAKPAAGGVITSTTTTSTTTTTPEVEPATTPEVEPATEEPEVSAATLSPIQPPTMAPVTEPPPPPPEEVEGTTEDELEEETTTTSTTTTTTTTTKRPPRPKPPSKPHKPKPKPKPKPSTTQKPPAEEEHFKVVCYFTNWAWYRQGEGKYLPSDIDPELCTHIIYGFAVLDSDQLTIKPHDTWADFDNKFYEKVIGVKKKKSGIKVLIAIGGWNDSAGDKYSRLVNSAAARQRFIKHVLQFIQEHSFDGLDLDWEYPKCWQVNCQQGPDSDKEAFAAFVRELKEAFTPHGLLLSAAVSPSRAVITAGYDVKALSKYLDWISVMAYDYHGQWDKVTGHVAPMYPHPDDDDVTFNTNFTMHYWMRQGADRRKLVLGMPMYGQSFSLASTEDNDLNAPTYGGGEAGEQTRARGFLAYYEICQRTLKNGWEVVRDEEGRIGPYARLRDQWVSFDDQAMIAHKANYVKQNDFGGAMIWALDLDDFRNLCGCEEYPLLKTINRVLRKYRGPQPECRLTPAQDGDNAESAITEFPERNEIGLAERETDCVNGLMAHPGDCTKYYSCWQNGGSIRSTMLSCPDGLHFDSVRRVCEWPDKAVCLQQRSPAATDANLHHVASPVSYFAGKFPWSSLQQGLPVWFAQV